MLGLSALVTDLDRLLAQLLAERSRLSIPGRRERRRRHPLLGVKQAADLHDGENRHRQQRQFGQMQESALHRGAQVGRGRPALTATAVEEPGDEADQPEQRGQRVLAEGDVADHLGQPQLGPDVRGDRSCDQRKRHHHQPDELLERQRRAVGEGGAAGRDDQLLDRDQQDNRVQAEQREADR
ncbi:hypothetical protein GCM10009765_19220 [Fodinicola feengrottensis]|uniref:Uncharacterized protein n=1 Tax=Fodinicola feengrottensis TaxID=435914 RepID=A0ABN2GED0_9ACTN